MPAWRIAQFEREMISERTRDKMAAMARKGKRTGGFPIIGYDIDRKNKRLVVNQQEAEQVREMFSLYLRTKSLYATAKIMNERGCRMKEWVTAKGNRTGGAKFTRSSVWYLLCNPLYLGKITFRGEVMPGEHQAIVSEEIFNGVKLALNGNGKGRRNRLVEELKHVYLLKGLVRCGSCGTSMIPHATLKKKKGQRFFYYRCLAVNKMNKTACNVRSVPAKALEEFALKRLGLLSANPSLIENIVNAAKESFGDELPAKKRQKSFLAAELGKLDVEAKNLVGLLAEQGPQTPRRPFYEARLDELAANKEELKRSLDNLEQEILGLECQQIDAALVQHSVKNFVSILGNLEPKDQKELLGLLIKEVIFDGRNSEIQIGLKPLPKIWGNVTELKGRFVYCQSWLPGQDSNLQPIG